MNLCKLFFYTFSYLRLIDGDVRFSNLEKYTEYDVFVRAKAIQSKANAQIPNELIKSTFSKPVRIRTNEDGNTFLMNAS